MIIIIAIIFLLYLFRKKAPRPPKIEEPPVAAPAFVPPSPCSQEETEIVSKCFELSHSHADIGTVTPIEVYSADFCIIPYQSCRLDAQNEIAMKLHSLNADISRHYIIDNWKGSDIMYVMISGNAPIGSIAVDRKNFEPFISHLYVDEAYRKKGYGKRLLEHGIEYSRAFKFNAVKLWCEEAMIPYYIKHGWEKDKYTAQGLCIMKYSL